MTGLSFATNMDRGGRTEPTDDGWDAVTAVIEAEISEAEFEAKRDEWLPSDADRAYVRSLMKPVYEPGKFANWIAPPPRGINGQPIDFDYVRLG